MTLAWDKIRSLLSRARLRHPIKHAELRVTHPPRPFVEHAEPSTVPETPFAPTDDGMALVYEAVERELRAAGLGP